MKSKSDKESGQALVEFILILPIFLIIMLTILDFSNIAFKRYNLGNDLDTIVDMYEDNNLNLINSYALEKDIKISYGEEEYFTNVNVSKNIGVISPILAKILGKDYQITLSKKIYKG